MHKIPAPKGSKDNPLAALIFDSLYDPYKGVIVFCRIKEGTVRKGTKIRMMATGAEFDTVEVGYFGAGQFIPCDELTAVVRGSPEIRRFRYLKCNRHWLVRRKRIGRSDWRRDSPL